MSIEAITWAFEQESARGGVKLVLLALANYADEQGYCFPSQKRLAKLTGESEITVWRHLAKLEGMRLIRREARRTPRGRWTSDAFYLLAPPDRLKPRRPPGGARVGSPAATEPAAADKQEHRAGTSRRQEVGAGETLPPASSARRQDSPALKTTAGQSDQRQNLPLANPAGGRNEPSAGFDQPSNRPFVKMTDRQIDCPSLFSSPAFKLTSGRAVRLKGGRRADPYTDPKDRYPLLYPSSPIGTSVDRSDCPRAANGSEPTSEEKEEKARDGACGELTEPQADESTGAESDPDTAQPSAGGEEIEIPVRGGIANSLWKVPDDLIGEFEAAYAIDVRRELRHAALYLRIHDDKRRPAREMPAFLNSWLLHEARNREAAGAPAAWDESGKDAQIPEGMTAAQFMAAQIKAKRAGISVNEYLRRGGES